MLGKVAIIILCLVMQACVSLPKCNSVDVSGEEKYARLIVYRESKSHGLLSMQKIALDDCLMGTLTNGSYMVAYVPVGKHRIFELGEFGKEYASTEFPFEAGKDYFIRWSFKSSLTFVTSSGYGASSTSYFTPVTREQAELELKKIKDI